jgi:transposase
MMKFVHGITRDDEAVAYGILLKAGNDKIEGKMNKLKIIKRDMSGR